MYLQAATSRADSLSVYPVQDCPNWVYLPRFPVCYLKTEGGCRTVNPSLYHIPSRFGQWPASHKAGTWIGCGIVVSGAIVLPLGCNRIGLRRRCWRACGRSECGTAPGGRDLERLDCVRNGSFHRLRDEEVHVLWHEHETINAKLISSARVLKSIHAEFPRVGCPQIGSAMVAGESDKVRLL